MMTERIHITLPKRKVEVIKDEIRKMLVLHIQNFLQEIFTVAEEFYMDIPP